MSYKSRTILILQFIIIFSYHAFSQNNDFNYINEERGVNVEVKFLANPTETRIDNAFGDRNLICSCSTIEELSEDS